MSAECPTCDGFGHVPEGEDGGWYRRDWRLILDPTVRWRPCPACRPERSPLSVLHQRLTELLVARMEAAIETWNQRGDWRHGVSDEGQAAWRWRDVLCLPPGPETDHQGWLLASDLGVQRVADRAELDQLLHKMGAPPLADR